jgi:hypothetical protein
MTTSTKTGACYTGLDGATVLAEVRTISGLPSHHHLLTCIKDSLFLELKRPQIIIPVRGARYEENSKLDFKCRQIFLETD